MGKKAGITIGFRVGMKGMEKKMETNIGFRVSGGNEAMGRKVETTIGFRV